MVPLQKSIVYLNGPPHSGKDEIAAIMSIRYGFHHLKFADVIKDIVCAAFSINRLELEELKDKISPLDVTYRQFLIMISEEFFKPKFGKSVFGDMILEKVRRTPHERIIFSDSGFFDEFKPVAYANYRGRNLVLEVHRPGYDFREDSRSYWYLDNESDAKRLAKRGVINNDTTLKAFRAQASRKICKEMGIEWIEEHTPLE